MAQEAPLSRDDPISTLVARCFQSFGDLDAHISRGTQSPLNRIDEYGFMDELGRLRVWAANIGAHRTGRTSLDFCLRDALHIRTRIQGLLYDLEENIRRTSDIISGASLPWDRLELDSDSDTESSEGELGDEKFGGTEQEQLKNSIHETITLLSRLSIAVRNPAMHHRHISSSQTVAVASSKFDIDHVSNKFPHAPSDLANNLGKAISRRRQYLKSQKERHAEASSEITTATALPEAIKSMNQENPVRESYSDSEASHTSFVRSNLEDGERQRIPPFPQHGAGGAPFECPICFKMISVHSQESWKRHVFRDIHPYVCTFSDCTTPQRLFSRRREWFLHELEMHRCHWQCAHGCWGDFKTASQFEEHVTTSHPESASPKHLAELFSASSMPVSQQTLVNCNMCGEKDLSLQKLELHLGRHQEDLALFAMPFAGYDLEEEEEEANANIKSEFSVSSSVEDDRQETLNKSNGINDGDQHLRNGNYRDGENEREETEPIVVESRHADIRPVPSSLRDGSMITTDSWQDPAEPDVASNHTVSAPFGPSDASEIICTIGDWQSPTNPKTTRKLDPATENFHFPQMQEADQEPGPRRSRRPPQIVTQPDSRQPYDRSEDTNRDVIQSASSCEFAQRLSASFDNIRVNSGNAQPEETEDQHQTRIECESSIGRGKLSRERTADEFWAQCPASKMQPRENTGNVADRPLGRKSNVGSSVLSLILPALANLKNSLVHLSRRPQKRPPQFRDDFQRNIRIVIPHRDGNEDHTRVHVATFDTRADRNFISENLVQDWYQAPSRGGDTQHDPPLPSISSIDGREFQVRGRISLHFQVQDKPCLHKKVFAQCRFIEADFLIVRPQTADCGFEVIIGLKTFMEEGLDKQTVRCFSSQGDRRELHPETAEDNDTEIARQRQRELKVAEEVEQGYAETSSDRRATAVPKAKKRRKRFGRRS